MTTEEKGRAGLDAIRQQIGGQGGAVTDDQLERVLTRVLEKKGVINRPAPVSTGNGKVCPVCKHRGEATDDGKCPNNNCPRHADGNIVGLHPEHSHPMFNADEYKAAVDAHRTAAAAG